MLTNLFKSCYLNNISNNYSLFYDDFYEYGNLTKATHAAYFVPGLNGVPGQLRFAFPAIKQIFGNNIYLKCFYAPEFSATIPIWEKYTIANSEIKSRTIAADLTELCQRFKKVMVLVSSSGFYDFVKALNSMPPSFKEKLILFWVACSPPQFQSTFWHPFFYKINGFTHNNFEWAAFPNLNFIKFINREADTQYKWKIHQQRKILFKTDLESRFRCLNLQWFYASIGCFNAYISHLLKDIKTPLDIPSYALVAENDGYWNGMHKEEITQTLQKFMSAPHILFKKASHLWVAVPENITALINTAIKANDIIM